MIRALLHYLFPSISPRDRLPLLPRHPSSAHGRHRTSFADEEIALMKGFGLARTDHDARRVLARYPGKRMMEIYKLEKRQRRRSRIGRAIRRFKALWF